MALLDAILRIFAPLAHADAAAGDCVSPYCTLITSGFGIEGLSGPLTVNAIVNNIVTVLGYTIVTVCTAIFIAGAFFFVVSAGNEERKSLGKDLMLGAVYGVAIVVGARLILELTLFFIYGNS